MIIGAVLMYIVVDGKKLDSKIAGWYDEYKEEMKDKPYGHYERGTFDKTVKLMIAAWFLFAWPSVLWYIVCKIIAKGYK